MQDVIIVGAGGMGALFGAILSEGGLSVVLLDTDVEHVIAIQNNGLLVEGFGGKRRIPLFATTKANELVPARLIFFQCKSYDTVAAARSVRHLVGEGSPAVSFQNGLGNERELEDILGKGNVIGGLTTMAGLKLGPGRVRDFSRTVSYVGEIGGGESDRVASLAQKLSSAGLETVASSDINRKIWKKLLGNIAMSAISAIVDMSSAECLALDGIRSLAMRALDEALAVARAEGFNLERDDVVAGLAAITEKGGTGDNRSSLCEDIRNNRRTEVDYIYGTVIALGKVRSVPTPTLDALAALVRAIEARNRGETP